ncbi:glycosyltransferase family 39 protein [Kribbella albertanoniae]|uniref:Uncharacterized protein n=1 Tax=Kribbella albertanoniae TaxID=1266829 RepID=A0A4R4Q3R7_9ACTN|nr:glycosyltransferase family 39 protein [Kribbella albertanoniae]TDC29716.1 hypothetical protein E1261_14960 [Kribbella albertanoniae]
MRLKWLPVAVLSLLGVGMYSWALTRGQPHEFYSAAAMSMSQSWSAFFYGALDPAVTITTDKLPGALWVHAAFIRLFGQHEWVLLLPQALAGATAVPLLFGAVRRWAGDRAAVVAGSTYLAMPISFAAAQISIPDPLLTTCLTAAAYTLVRALDGDQRWLLLSAAIVGAAFQVKMLQAWVLVPVFGLTYLICAKAAARIRWLNVFLYGGVALLASVAWMSVISLIPTSRRPLLDGSEAGSPWEMVFLYNGIDRSAAGEITTILSRFSGTPGPLRLFNEQLAPQAGWLLPLAVLALVTGLVTSRTAGRHALSGWILWGGWLGLNWIAFSVLSGLHPYYLTVLSPAIAALVGAGIDQALTAWRTKQAAGWVLPAGIVITAGWSVLLIERQLTGLPWLMPLVAGLAVLALVLLFLQRSRFTLVATTAAVLAAPLCWTLSTPAIPEGSTRIISPIAGPPAYLAPLRQDAGATGVDAQLLAYLQARREGERFLFATGESSKAADYLYAGFPVLPFRGFTSGAPSVPAEEVSRLVSDRELRFILMMDQPGMTPRSTDRVRWIKQHCQLIDRIAYGATGPAGPWDADLYDCY